MSAIFTNILRIQSMKRLYIIIILYFFSISLHAEDSAIDELSYQYLKSPTVATIKSALIPGWGQYYVESYFKSALFLGTEATFVYILIDNHSKYTSARDEYEAAKDRGDDDYVISRLEANMKAYHNNRDQTAFYMLGIHVLSAIDAYVGAHLFEFDVTDEIKLGHFPNKYGYPSLLLSIQF